MLDGNAPAPFLYGLAQQAWNLGIYHLRLATTQMLVMQARRIPEQEKAQFVELAEGWFSDDAWLNGAVIDVLKALGVLHDRFTAEEASAEFKKVIELPLVPKYM